MEEFFFCCGGAGRKNDSGVPASKKPVTSSPVQTESKRQGMSNHPQSEPVNQNGIAFTPPSLRMMHELPDFYDINFGPRGEIGRGHFARVYRGKHLATGAPVAAKRILRSGSKTETLHNEIKALARLHHPNIVRLYDVFYDDIYVVLILEFLGGGELFARIVKGGAYSERDAASHFRDLAGAIAYMHSHNIVHRDLKPENLVLAKDGKNSIIKISDFGLSKIIDGQDGMVTVCGTRAYSAPEINFGNDPLKKGKRYSAKVDVWSMGVILYVILGAYHPFDPYGSYDNDEIWRRISSGQWDFGDKVWNNISDAAKDLLTKMICVDPEKRLSMEEVLQHPWLQQWEELPTTNLPSVNNAQFRERMGSEIDTQTHFSTQQTTNNSFSKMNHPKNIGSIEMDIVDEKEDLSGMEAKLDADVDMI